LTQISIEKKRYYNLFSSTGKYPKDLLPLIFETGHPNFLWCLASRLGTLGASISQAQVHGVLISKTGYLYGMITILLITVPVARLYG